MYTPGNEAELATHAIDPHPPREPRAMCPPTPPPETGAECRSDNTLTEYNKDDGAIDGNSAGALNLVQERSLYITSEGIEEDTLQDSRLPVFCESEKDKVAKENGLEIDTPFKADVTMLEHSASEAASMPTPQSVAMDEDTTDLFGRTEVSQLVITHTRHNPKSTDEASNGECMTANGTSHGEEDREKLEARPTFYSGSTNMSNTNNSYGSPCLPPTPRFDFSNTRLYPLYPSSFLRPGSKFSGTQQSDRQIYNVDVQILTLSVPESNMTGYLRICGLTEDHPTLTTFFTGEIIGGPTHKHTFQTKDASWGATDRTDLQHWARFPAWRPLTKDAKRDINFNYPPLATGLGSQSTSSSPHPATVSDDVEDRGSDNADPGWWTQPNIFMRWKEWFLVPDHRVRSIQGASFEGFYYICFNQVEGKINGIYFHARSEK
jgi:glucose-induced degradation protein 4